MSSQKNDNTPAELLYRGIAIKIGGEFGQKFKKGESKQVHYHYNKRNVACPGMKTNNILCAVYTFFRKYVYIFNSLKERLTLNVETKKGSG